MTAKTAANTLPDSTKITQQNFIQVITEVNESLPYLSYKTLLNVVATNESIGHVRKYFKDRPELNKALVIPSVEIPAAVPTTNTTTTATPTSTPTSKIEEDEESSFGDDDISWDDDGLSDELSEEEEHQPTVQVEEQTATPKATTPAPQQTRDTTPVPVNKGVKSQAVTSTAGRTTPSASKPIYDDDKDELFSCECPECQLTPPLDDDEDEFESAVKFICQSFKYVPLALVFNTLDSNDMDIKTTFKDLINGGFELKEGFPTHTKSTSPLRNKGSKPSAAAASAATTAPTRVVKESAKPAPLETKNASAKASKPSATGSDVIDNYDDIEWDDDALSGSSEEEVVTMANVKPVSTASEQPKAAPKATPKQSEPKVTEIVEDEDNISWDDDGFAEDDDDEDEDESEPYHDSNSGEYADGIDWDDDAISDADSEGGSTPVQTSNSKPYGASTKTDIEWDDDGFDGSDSNSEDVDRPSESQHSKRTVDEIDWDDDGFDEDSAHSLSEDDGTDVRKFSREQSYVKSDSSKPGPGVPKSRTVEALAEAFPTIPRSKIQEVYAKCKNDFDKALSGLRIIAGYDVGSDLTAGKSKHSAGFKVSAPKGSAKAKKASSSAPGKTSNAGTQPKYAKIDPRVDYVLGLEIYDSLMDMFPDLTFNQVKNHFFNNQSDLFKARISLLKLSEKLKAQAAKAQAAAPPAKTSTAQQNTVPKQPLPMAAPKLSAFNQRIENMVQEYQKFPSTYIKQLLAENKYKFEDVEKKLNTELKTLQREDSTEPVSSSSAPANVSKPSKEVKISRESDTQPASMSIDDIASHPYFANSLAQKEEDSGPVVPTKDKFSDEFEFLTESFDLLSFDTVKEVLLSNNGDLLLSINTLLTLDAVERTKSGLPQKAYESAETIIAKYAERIRKPTTEKSETVVAKKPEPKKPVVSVPASAQTPSDAPSAVPAPVKAPEPVKKVVTREPTGVGLLLKPAALAAVQQAAKTSKDTVTVKSKKDPIMAAFMSQAELRLKKNIKKFILGDSIVSFDKSVDLGAVERMARIEEMRRHGSEEDDDEKESEGEEWTDASSEIPQSPSPVVKKPVVSVQPQQEAVPKMKLLRREKSQSPIPTPQIVRTPTPKSAGSTRSTPKPIVSVPSVAASQQSKTVVDQKASANLESIIRGKSRPLSVRGSNVKEIMNDMAVRAKDGINVEDAKGTFNELKETTPVNAPPVTASRPAAVMQNGFKQSSYYDYGDDDSEEDPEWDDPHFSEEEQDTAAPTIINNANPEFQQTVQPNPIASTAFDNFSNGFNSQPQFNPLASASFGASPTMNMMGQSSLTQLGGGSIWNTTTSTTATQEPSTISPYGGSFGFGGGAFASNGLDSTWSSHRAPSIPQQPFGNMTTDSLISDGANTAANSGLFQPLPQHPSQTPSLSAQLGSNNYQFGSGSSMMPGLNNLPSQVGLGGNVSSSSSSFFPAMRSGSSVGLQSQAQTFGLGASDSPFGTTAGLFTQTPPPQQPATPGFGGFFGSQISTPQGTVPQSTSPSVNYDPLAFDDSRRSSGAVSSLAQSNMQSPVVKVPGIHSNASPFPRAASVGSPLAQHVTSVAVEIDNTPLVQPSFTEIQETTDFELAHKVDSLFSMFPNVPKSQIQTFLLENDEDLERTTDLLLNYGELSKFNEEEHEQSEQEKEEEESDDDDWQVAGPRFPNNAARTERSDQSDVDMNAFARKQEALLNQRQQERLQHLQFEEEERARQAEEERVYLAQAQEASNHSLQDTDWDDHSDNIRTIADLTALTREEVEPFYYRNNYDINSTLVDIVQDFNANLESNLKNLKEKFISELPRNSRPNIPAGGRVQSLPNFSMTLKDKEIVEKRLKEASGKLAYQYDDDGEDAKQLRILLVTNPRLSGIYWEFYIKLLKFFAGAYYKAMTFALYLVEHDGISKTLDASWKTNSGSTAPGSSSGVSNATSLRQKKNGYKDNKSPFVSSSDLFKAPAVIKSEVTAASSAKLVEALSNRTLEKGLDDDQIELQRGQLSQVSASGKIDLHRFIVPNAKVTTQKVLKDWWAEEVRLREHHGILKAGYNAKYIEPLDIITGRGLHSEGVSKVKNAIGLLLKKENYVFEELVGRFRVHGYKGNNGF